MKRAWILLLLISSIASAQGKSARPWGESLPSELAEKNALALFDMLASGEPARVKTSITVGPGLWLTLAKDPALARLGIPVTGTLTWGDKKVVATGRGFSPGHDLAAAVETKTMKMLGLAFRNGKARPASEKERQLYYVGISFEIEKDPVTVVTSGKNTILVFFLKSDDQTMVWLEDLNAFFAILSHK